MLSLQFQRFAEIFRNWLTLPYQVVTTPPVRSEFTRSAPAQKLELVMGQSTILYIEQTMMIYLYLFNYVYIYFNHTL